MGGIGKPTHIDTDFGGNNLRHVRTHTGNFVQTSQNRINVKWRQKVCNLLIQPPQQRIAIVDVL